jgi:Tfp pilus assembly protein PilO
MAQPKVNLSILKKEEVKLALMGVGALVLLFIWYDLFFVPTRANLQDVGLRAKTMAQDVKLVKEKMTKLGVMQKQLDEMAAQYDARMITMLPEEQLPELFQVITQAARTSDVRIANIKPKVEVNQLSPSTSGFLEVPIQVDASGAYHNLGKFLDAIESSKALFRVREIKVEANPADIWHHEASVVIWAYLFPGGERSK